jgi:hypothetical protein
LGLGAPELNQSSGHLVPMFALGKLLDHLSIEGRYVIRIAACYQAVVNHHLAINPLRAGIFQIRF